MICFRIQESSVREAREKCQQCNRRNVMTTRVRLVQEAGRRRVEVRTTQSSSSQYSRESLHPALCLAWLQQLNFGQMFSNFSRNLKTLNKLKERKGCKMHSSCYIKLAVLLSAAVRQQVIVLVSWPLVIITTFLSGPDLLAINPDQADLTAALIKSPDISTFNFVKEFET